MTAVTLDTLHAMPSGVERYRAVQAYIAAGEAKVREARRLGDADLHALRDEHGPTEAARLAGVSVSTVNRAAGRP